ncbi:MAG: hypothetical protein ACLU37_03650 [Collinsella sp.]
MRFPSPWARWRGGIYAASLGISEYRAQREERLFQPDAMGGAANLNQHQSEFKTASIPAQQQDATLTLRLLLLQAQAEQSTSAYLSGLTGAFQRRHADDGVPTIARAADAMDEAEAWSMIDSMLDDDSPVSCDPAHSRDVYQVAIDELTNGGQTGSFNRDDMPPPRAPCRAPAAPAGSTAAFVALVANAAANNAYNATSGDANASADYSYVDEAITADEEAVAARRAAESSLWGAPAQQQAAEAAPYNANLASMPIISGAADIDLTTSMNPQPSPHRLMPKIASTPATFRTPR